MKVPTLIFVAAAALSVAAHVGAGGDPQRGAQQFRQCAACHSVAPGEHLTGPSLAEVFGSRAGANKNFGRYSPALRESDIVWTEEALDKWLQDPTSLVPGTSMRIRGIDDHDVRHDIIAYLRSGLSGAGDSASGGMMDGMGPSRLMSLKETDSNQRVNAIRYCGDAYYVTLGTGNTYTFWEFNLRFKSDSSDNGPPRGQPVIVASGMRGDRAFVIFADPGEISDYIEKKC